MPIDALLLIGPTGSGKSPLGDQLGSRGFLGRPCLHLDFGAELRGAVAGGTGGRYTGDELLFLRGVLERGLLLENEHFALAKKIITSALERSGFSSRHLLVLNGIPRHAGQARDMASVARVHAVIELDGTADVIYRRLHTNIGGDRTERSDDDHALVAKKLAIFHERTASLVDHYQRSGSVVYRIAVGAATTTAEHYERLLSLAAVHPPVALVAEPPQGRVGF